MGARGDGELARDQNTIGERREINRRRAGACRDAGSRGNSDIAVSRLSNGESKRCQRISGSKSRAHLAPETSEDIEIRSDRGL